MPSKEIFSVPAGVHCLACLAIERRIEANIREGLAEYNMDLAAARRLCEGAK